MLPKKLVAASLKPIMMSLLSRGDQYGYEIIEVTKRVSGGDIRWTSNKLYPLLHGMEQEGVLKSYWRPSDDGPDRKYYHLTSKGARELTATQDDWTRLIQILGDLWGPELQLTWAGQKEG